MPRRHRLHLRAHTPLRDAPPLVVAGGVRRGAVLGGHAGSRSRGPRRRRALAASHGSVAGAVIVGPPSPCPLPSVRERVSTNPRPRRGRGQGEGGARRAPSHHEQARTRMTLPLQGITVVEIAQNLAGPIAAEILAHMGADVVKIERPEGDDARRWGPPFWKGVSPGFLAVNANKRRITLDLKKAEDVEWLVELLGRADVLVPNLRPASLEE